MILILHAQLLVMHAQTLLPSEHSQATENQEIQEQYAIKYTKWKLLRQSEETENKIQLYLF